ncbi:MAG TPA: AraC family transcriptional regulator [Chthoniobacterales bacterium]|jgi:AraC-like DNA-binding protein
MSLPSDSLHIAMPLGNASETAHSPRYFWDNQRRANDPFVIIQRTRSGCGTLYWDDRTWQVPPNHAFIAMVPETSSYGFPADGGEPWNFSWLTIYGSLGVRLFKDFREMHGPVLSLPETSSANALFNSLVAQAERRVVQEPSDATSACFLFLMEWKRLVEMPGRRDADPVEKAMRICQSRFREPIGIKELAVQTGLSREHFSRLFAQNTGVPPALYLRGLRLEAARGVMAAGGTLKEAALRCGFPSPNALKRALS